MKQNQSLFRPVPGETPCTRHYDLLGARSSCQCSQCGAVREQVVPEISLDLELQRLRANNRSGMAVCDQVVFLNEFQRNESNLPRFRFLDTVVLSDGEPSYALYFQDGRARLARDLSIKTWVLGRKQQLDLRYQIKKYERDHPSFHFAAFEHESEKRIKEFQNNIRYKMPPMLNKVAILKLRGEGEEKLVSKSEFEDLFSTTKSRTYELEDIEYIQVFPIMHGEEDSSYLRTIKYFRSQECSKRSFKLAECYALTWRERNDSLQKLQQGVFLEISAATNEPISEQMRLQYMTYKLLIHFEEISNLRIEEALVHYITNDQGATVYFKKIECIRFEKRVPVADIGIDLPSKKEYPVEDHINLREEMRKLFGGFQKQFSRLDKEREEMQAKVRKDREYSNYVFHTVSQRKGDNLHKILGSSNQRYKKDQLGL